jgi:hypothetical protein
MPAYDWVLPAGSPLCVFSDAFYRTGREAVFQQLTTDTTPEQFQAAEESLQRLRDELVTDMPAMHYGSLVGTHRCVNHLYREASARLRSLAVLQPVPPPPAPPRETPADVVRDLRDTIQPNPETTTLGADDSIDEDRHPR